MTSAESRGRIRTSIGRQAHDLQRVDLLAHLHRAELGGDRRAGAAGDHDRCEQHRHFAQDEDADEIDGVCLRAELAQLKDALLRDDRADEKIDEHDDRHAAQRKLLDVKDERSDAKPTRADEYVAEGGDDVA